MKMLKGLLTGMLLATLTGQAFAGEDLFKVDVQKKFPNTPIDEVRPSALPGLFEVTSGKNVYYVDKTLHYAVFGGIIDTTTGVNLTDERVQSISKVDVKNLPLQNSVTIGTGKKNLYLFSDPDCPYCKKLHPELAKLKNVTIHEFLYPIKELHPGAFYHAVAIWCSKDRKKALDEVFSGKQIDDAVCENPIGETVKLGQSLGISGTPTIIFEDGSMQVGYLASDQLQARLDGKPQPNVSGSLSGELKEVPVK